MAPRTLRPSSSSSVHQSPCKDDIKKDGVVAGQEYNARSVYHSYCTASEGSCSSGDSADSNSIKSNTQEGQRGVVSSKAELRAAPDSRARAAAGLSLSDEDQPLDVNCFAPFVSPQQRRAASHSHPKPPRFQTQHKRHLLSNTHCMEKDGLHFNPLLAALFGVDFLPYCPNERYHDDDSSNDDSYSPSTPSIYTDTNDSFVTCPMDEEETTPAEFVVAQETTNDAPAALFAFNSEDDNMDDDDAPSNNKGRQHNNKKKKRVGGAIHALRRSVHKGTFGRNKTQPPNGDATPHRESSMTFKKLSSLKNNLATVHSDTLALLTQTQTISKQVASVAKNVATLQRQLDVHLRVIDKERSRIETNLQTIGNLEETTNRLEQEIHAFERQTLIIGNTRKTKKLLVSHGKPSSPHRTESNTSLVSAGSSSKASVASADSSTGGGNMEIMMKQQQQYKGTESETTTRLTSTPPKSIAVAETTTTSSPAAALSRRLGVQDAHNNNNNESLFLKNASKLRLSQRPAFLIRIHDLTFPSQSYMPFGNNSFLSYSSSATTVVASNRRLEIVSLEREEERQLVLDALVTLALGYATDDDNHEGSRWIPERSTDKFLSKQQQQRLEPRQASFSKEILLWSGKASQDGYGCELPMIKARGWIRASSRSVLDLLLDSTRVKEYNTMSMGRTDVLHYDHLSSGVVDNVMGETKIIKSLTKPPLIRKQIELLSLLHARAILENNITANNNGGCCCYVVVSRSVWEKEEMIPPCSKNDEGSILRSEMLLGVNLIRECSTEYCELTTVTHFSTQGLPTFGAKKFAMNSAYHFLRNIQLLLER